MGHHDDRGVEMSAQVVEDAGLDRRVDRARGVVEQQQPRRTCQGPGQSHALSLPSRERLPPLAHHRR